MDDSRSLSGAPMVTIAGLKKSFGEVTAIGDMSVDVANHEFLSIVGPSGCGKSTALRVIAGLTDPTAGKVLVRGEEVRGPIKDVGMVFQAPVLLPWRSVLNNVLFPIEMSGQRRSKYEVKARELISLAGLDGFENHAPYQLSGGMQQRVAICRALVSSPQLLLMDEPFGALDIMTRERMGFELQKIWSVGRQTVIFVTHSITEAVLLSDTIVVMSGRPGTVKKIVKVDLPRPRLPALMKDPRFVELAADVRDQIDAQWVE